MCGRYTLNSAGDRIAKVFDLDQTPELTPRFNISPGQEAPVIRDASEVRSCGALHWGFAPHRKGERFLINARSETVSEKPSFRSGFETRRCLVPATGFYEWRKNGPSRAPYHLRLKSGEIFAMAGIWRHRTDEPTDDKAPDAFVVMTTTANRVVAAIHDRMPVILGRSDYDRWLDPSNQNPSDLAGLLRPLAGDLMESYPVSSFVNSAHNEGERCLEKVEEAPVQRSLFEL